ncbi:MAG: hypothetical protein K2Y22_14280 [Candidatus Obscuribacterales bacterium]|nr:hypothetical protein [Candidatus Obscuribacterales bacterium]
MRKPIPFFVFASMCIAYVVSFIYNLIYCKPNGVVETLGAFLTSAFLALYTLPLIWVGTVVVMLPLIVAGYLYFKDTGIPTIREVWVFVWQVRDDSNTVDAEAIEASSPPLIAGSRKRELPAPITKEKQCTTEKSKNLPISQKKSPLLLPLRKLLPSCKSTPSTSLTVSEESTKQK